MKTKFVLPLLLGLLLTAFTGPAARSAEPEKKASAGTVGQTVVVFDSVGGFAPATVSLIVYSDGLSILACSRGSSEKITRTRVPVAQVQTLQKALQAAGALTLPSSLKPIPDIPTKIVTFFKPRASAGQTPSNTFGYVDTAGPYGKVQSAIDNFLKSGFPTC